MKGIINVSIAGIAFKLEEEAFSRLEKYLASIRNHYGNSPEGKEIQADIEARIAEIILTQQDASVVVPLSLINGILDRLGSAEDISGETDEKQNRESYPDPETSGKRIAHRLYRNPDEAKIGGVCSGLAAYFNIDPVFIRLIFLLPAILFLFFIFLSISGIRPWWLGGGFIPGLTTVFVILYFLLWIVIPKAKTPLQKMEMRGEKVTKERLEQTFRQEFQSRSNDPSNIEMRARNERSASAFSEAISIIGKILLFCVKAFAAILGFCLILGIVAIIASIIVLPLHFAGEWHEFIFTPLEDVMVILLVLTLIIPLVLAVFGILKLLFGFKQGKTFVSTMVVIWVLTLVFGTVIFIKEFNNIRIDGKTISEWRHDGRTFPEIIQDHWDHDVDMTGASTMSQSSSLGDYKRTTTWTALEIGSDTLIVAPMHGAEVSPNFVLTVNKGNDRRFPAPTLAIGKSYKASGEEKENRYFEKITVDHELRNDTLFLTPRIPNLPKVREEYARGELFVPGNMTVKVDRRIYSREYYTQKD